MSNKLQFSGQSGLTAYALIRDRETDYIWNGSEFVVLDTADINDYVVSLAGTGHFYSGTFPSTITTGHYHVTYLTKTGGSYSYDDDEVVFQQLYDWDGSDLVSTSTSGSISKTDICNMALSHLGISRELSDVETEETVEAESCRRFYETARDATLRDFDWPFATQFSELGLVEEDPTSEWAYSYRYPSNALKIRRIFSGIRNDDRQSRVSYKIGRDDTGLLIFTDMEDAEIEYTMKETDPGRYPIDFVNALSYRLAMYIAPRLTSGNTKMLSEEVKKMYIYEIDIAKSNAGNEQQDDEVSESEFIRARS